MVTLFFMLLAGFVVAYFALKLAGFVASVLWELLENTFMFLIGALVTLFIAYHVYTFALWVQSFLF